MHTRCPDCHTTFRVTDAQLAAANGRVRCGSCRAVFDGTAYLQPESPEPLAATDDIDAVDEVEPVEPSAYSAEPEPPDDEAAEPEQPDSDPEPDETELSEGGLDREPEPDEVDDAEPEEPDSDPELDETELSEDGFDWEPEPEPDEADDAEPELADELVGIDPYEHTPEETAPEELLPQPAEPAAGKPDTNQGFSEEHIETLLTADDLEQLAVEPNRPEEPEAVLPPFETDPEPDEVDELPPLLADRMDSQDTQPRRSPLALLGWTLLLIPLTALLAGQYLWYNRLTLAETHPELRPVLESACAVAGCTMPPRRDVNAFRLTERDVRFHPEVADALLISAAFVNGAPFAQPYPQLEVVLKNIRGEIVASRQFTPDEYLGRHIAQPIPPGTETQLTLAVADPGKEAVAFEFNFR